MTRYLISMFMLTWGSLSIFAEPADVDTLQELVGQWVELHKQVAQENREWKNQREALQREIGLLDKELKRLDTNIAFSGDSHRSYVQKVAEKKNKIDQLEKTVASIGKMCDRIAVEVDKLLPRVPEPLQSDLLKHQKIKKVPRENRKGESSVKRLQQLLAVLGELQRLESESHAVQEILTVDGQRREMDVVYLGLAQGFAVAPDNSCAAVGVFKSSGWYWSADKKLAPEVRKLFDVKTKKKSPELVSLPLSPKVREVQP